MDFRILRAVCVFFLAAGFSVTRLQAQTPSPVQPDDKLLAEIQKRLPMEWEMEINGKEVTIRHPETIWFPLDMIYPADTNQRNQTRYEFREGRKKLMAARNAGFRFLIEPKWSKQKMEEALSFNDRIWQDPDMAQRDKRKKMKRIPSHMSERYSLFLLSDYGLTVDHKAYLPTYLYEQTGKIDKLINLYCKPVY